MLPLFPTKGMFSQMKVRHLVWKQPFPDRGQNRDYPFRGLSNPRPETQAASRPRIPAELMPFDPIEFIKLVFPEPEGPRQPAGGRARDEVVLWPG